ncbi:MAG TPA: apolipoprotein N-acyltransferase [Blastocatellia bacterium]|nr:apolipoprotein N-acyltransferase [Blastocatellia bacterium]
MRLNLSPYRFSLAPDSLLWQSITAVVSALLLILSFPPFELSFLAWVALAPLLKVIAEGVTVRRALWLGWLAGIEFTFFAENWIAHSMTHFGQMLTVIAYAVAMLFAAILAIFPAIFAAAMAELTRRFGPWAMAFAPAVWVATEWLRPIVTGVTWNALGVSQARHFRIASLSQLGGVYLVSAEIVAVNALIVLALKFRERSVARATALLFLIAAIFFLLPPQLRRQSTEGAKVTVVGVQPNLPPDSSVTERDLDNVIKLTKEAINRAPDKSADIVVWAESPLALFYENDEAVRERLDALARETGSYLIASTATSDSGRYFNSVHTVSPRSDSQFGLRPKPMRRYDKIRLVPFGEYVPWRSVLGRFVPAIVGDFTPGDEAVVNLLRLETERAAITTGDEGAPSTAIERTTNYVRVGAFICYEAAYPNLVRRFAQNGATLLVNVSNDAWFGNTAGARQHLMHAMMRAIENDRDLLRVTNAGISALITADGRLVDPLPTFTSAAQVWQARTRSDRTFYTQRGDWFAIGCAILTAVLLAASSIGRLRHSSPKQR